MEHSPEQSDDAHAGHSYQLSLLGGFSLLYNGRQLKTLTAPRLQSLLAYLFLNAGRQLERSFLASLFWPELSEEQARGHLRKTLFKLRENLPSQDEPLEQSKTSLLWKRQPLCDVIELERLLEQTPSLPLVRRVQQLVVGPLLPGCMDSWCLERREALDARLIHFLDVLLGSLEQRREYADLIELTQFRLRVDPLSEEPYVRLFRAHMVQGDRSAARKVWQECREVFLRELEAEPSLAFKKELERLEQSTTPTPPEPPASPQVQLIGRSQEWAALLECWRSVGQGQFWVAVISGVSGIGKTRLAHELVRWVSRQGFRVVGAECQAAEQRLAFSALSELVRDLPVPKLPVPVLSEVSRLIPDLAEQIPNLPVPPSLHEPGQRMRFFQAVSRYLMEQEPLLLMLDDVQWADDASLEWLLHVIRTMPTRKVLVVATLRLESLKSMSLLQQEFLPNLRKMRRCQELSLGPLTLDECSKLIEQESSGKVSGHVINELYAESEGTPLYLLELLRARYLEGLLPLHAGEYPHTLTEAIALRLSVLSQSARTVMELMATLGAPALPSLLVEALNISELNLLNTLDELRMAHLIEERTDLTYRISHGLIASILYRLMSLARRRLLHRSLAELLERQADSAVLERSTQLAFHFEQGLIPERAARYYVQAGEASFVRGASSEALNLLRKGLNCKNAPPEIRARALETLFDLHHWTGEYEECLRLVRALQALLQGTADHRALAMAYVKESNVLQFIGRLKEAAAPLTQALSLQVSEGELLRQEALLLRAELSLHHLTLGEVAADYEAARQLIPAVEAHSPDAGDRIPSIITLLSCGRLVEVRGVIEKALIVSSREQRRDCESVILYWRAFTRMVQGDLTGAESDYRESIRLAHSLESNGNVFRNQLNLARMLALQGRMRVAIGLCEALIPGLEAGGGGERMRLNAELGLYLGASGQLGRAVPLLEAATAEAVSIGNLRAVFRWTAYRAALLLTFGKPEQAAPLVHAARTLLPWEILAPQVRHFLDMPAEARAGVVPGTLLDLAMTSHQLEGELLVQQGQPEPALPLLRSAVALRPHCLTAAIDFGAHITLIEALWAIGRREEALAQWQTLSTLTDGEPPSLVKQPQFLWLGALLHQALGAPSEQSRLEHAARRALARLCREAQDEGAGRALAEGLLSHGSLSQGRRGLMPLRTGS